MTTYLLLFCIGAAFCFAFGHVAFDSSSEQTRVRPGLGWMALAMVLYSMGFFFVAMIVTVTVQRFA